MFWEFEVKRSESTMFEILVDWWKLFPCKVVARSMKDMIPAFPFLSLSSLVSSRFVFLYFFTSFSTFLCDARSKYPNVRQGSLYLPPYSQKRQLSSLMALCDLLPSFSPHVSLSLIWPTALSGEFENVSQAIRFLRAKGVSPPRMILEYLQDEVENEV